MAERKEFKALDAWNESFIDEQAPDAGKILRPKILKGSASRIPDAPPILGEIASAAAVNSPALLGGAAGVAPFAVGTAVDVTANRLFPPTAAELRGQAVGGLTQAAISAIPQLKKASLGKRGLAQLFGQSLAVGGEQQVEAALGNVSQGGALTNTFILGMMPQAAQEAIGAAGRKLSGKLDANVQEAYQSVVSSLDEFGIAFKSENGALKFANELASFMPFAKDQVVARDKRVFAAAFKKFREGGLSPDISVGKKTGRAGERTIESITDNVNAAFVQNGNVELGVDEIVDLFSNPKIGDPENFAVRSDFAGAFKGRAVKLDRHDMAAITTLYKSDPGTLIKRLGKDNRGLNVVAALDNVLPRADSQRIQNAYINEYILSPAIEQSKRGVNVDEVLGGAVTRDAPEQLLEVRPAKMKSTIESISDEKMTAVMRLGGRTNKQAADAISALKAVAQSGVDNNVGTVNRRGPAFLSYASNKFAFGTLAIGGAGAAGSSFGEEGSTLDRVGNLTQQVAAGAAIIVGMGTAMALAINHPKAAMALTKISKEGESGIPTFMRIVADTPFSFQPVEGKPGQIQLVEPLPEQEKQEQQLNQPGQTLESLFQQPGR